MGKATADILLPGTGMLHVTRHRRRPQSAGEAAITALEASPHGCGEVQNGAVRACAVPDGDALSPARAADDVPAMAGGPGGTRQTEGSPPARAPMADTTAARAGRGTKIMNPPPRGRDISPVLDERGFELPDAGHAQWHLARRTAGEVVAGRIRAARGAGELSLTYQKVREITRIYGSFVRRHQCWTITLRTLSRSRPVQPRLRESDRTGRTSTLDQADRRSGRPARRVSQFSS